MSRIRTFLIFFLVTLIVGILILKARPDTATGQADKKVALVTRIVDGDTIQVEIGDVTETVRVLGIDAPESAGPAKKVECYATEASLKAKEMLLNQEVFLEADKWQDDRDDFGRLLRYVFLKDGTNFNIVMIEQGLAEEYFYQGRRYRYRTEFVAAESLAKSGRLGLWGKCN